MTGHADSWIETPSGLILPKEAAQQAQRPKAMDFFAGCGGFSCGLISAGFEVVAMAEWEPLAAMTYMTNLCRWGQVRIHYATDADRKRLEKQLVKSYRKSGILIEDGQVVFDGKAEFPGHCQTSIPLAGTGWISGPNQDGVPGVSHIFFGDIAKLTPQHILDTLGMEPGELDLIFGSPPCQGFSTAGKQRIDDPRNELTFVFARFIVEMQPKTIMMENVPEIATMMAPDGVPVLDKFCRILEDGNFGTYDAFRKTIEMQTGRVGLMRKSKKQTRDKGGGKAKQSSNQADLFEEVA